MNKQFLLVLCAATSSLSLPVHARYQIWINDPFDMSWTDSMMDVHQQMMDRFANSFVTYGPPKEEQEKFKQAREQLAKITHEVKEDDTSVAITFKGFTDLVKDAVKVVKKEGGWFGTIAHKDGRIEFFISTLGVQVTSRIELKSEEKADADKKEHDKKAERTFYTSQSATKAEFFTSAVNISTLKAEPVKSTEFKLTVQKQKEEVLPLS